MAGLVVVACDSSECDVIFARGLEANTKIDNVAMLMYKIRHVDSLTMII